MVEAGLEQSGQCSGFAQLRTVKDKRRVGRLITRSLLS